MGAHRAEHAQREVGSTPKQFENLDLRDQQDSARLDSARVGEVSAWRSESGLGKGFTGPENVDNLLFAGNKTAH